MNISDLKIGMWLTDDGSGTIPLYDSPDGTGDTPLIIQPGDTIGQITDFSTGPAGPTVIFTSQAIYDTGTNVQKFGDWILKLVPQWILPSSPCLAANFKDIQANVTDAQVKSQSDALAATNLQSGSLGNLVISTMQDIIKGASAGTTGLFSDWNFLEVGALGLFTYLVLNSKAFYKP